MANAGAIIKVVKRSPSTAHLTTAKKAWVKTGPTTSTHRIVDQVGDDVYFNRFS